MTNRQPYFDNMMQFIGEIFFYNAIHYTIFFDVVPQNVESNVVPGYEVRHGGVLQMFKGRRLNIYHCAYFRNTRHAISFLE